MKYIEDSIMRGKRLYSIYGLERLLYTHNPRPFEKRIPVLIIPKDHRPSIARMITWCGGPGAPIRN
jgi:hypothetical protein